MPYDAQGNTIGGAGAYTSGYATSKTVCKECGAYAASPMFKDGHKRSTGHDDFERRKVDPNTGVPIPRKRARA